LTVDNNLSEPTLLTKTMQARIQQTHDKTLIT